MRTLIGQSAMVYLKNKEALAVYYTVIKHDGHFRTREKCRKHELQASVFYIFCVCPVSDNEFCHNIVKVALDPQGVSRVDLQTTLTMLF